MTGEVGACQEGQHTPRSPRSPWARHVSATPRSRQVSAAAVHRRATSEQRRQDSCVKKVSVHKPREATPCRTQRHHLQGDGLSEERGTSQTRVEQQKQAHMGSPKALNFREKPRIAPRVDVVPRVEAVAQAAARRAAAMRDLEKREREELLARRMELQKLRVCNALAVQRMACKRKEKAVVETESTASFIVAKAVESGTEMCAGASFAWPSPEIPVVTPRVSLVEPPVPPAELIGHETEAESAKAAVNMPGKDPPCLIAVAECELPSVSKTEASESVGKFIGEFVGNPEESAPLCIEALNESRRELEVLREKQCHDLALLRMVQRALAERKSFAICSGTRDSDLLSTWASAEAQSAQVIA